MQLISFESASEIVECEHEAIHKFCFPNGVKMASLVHHRSNDETIFTWGYDYDNHKIHVCLDDGDLYESNFTNLAPLTSGDFPYWPAWRIYLLHEMCHEYQYAVLANKADKWGVSQHKHPPKTWKGNGHTPAFYTGIKKIAETLGMEPIALAKLL